MIIDLHAHALSEKFLADLSKHPLGGFTCERSGAGFAVRRAGQDNPTSLDHHLHDLPSRLESLKRRKVELQLFGPPPGLLSWPGGVVTSELIRSIHRHEVELAAEAGGLLEPIAVPALGEPEKAADELRRAVEEHGFRALIMPSTAGGRPLDDPAFEPLFALIERLGLLIFMHPTSATLSERFGMYGVHVLVGWPFESSLAVTRLIFEGVLERHPALKLLIAHGGGNLVFLRGRLDSSYEATGWEANPYYRKNIRKPPSAYLAELYYDTCALNVDSNRFVIEVMGPDHVVFGSDYPFDIGDPEGRRSVPVVDKLPAAARDKVYRGTALRVLNPR